MYSDDINIFDSYAKDYAYLERTKKNEVLNIIQKIKLDLNEIVNEHKNKKEKIKIILENLSDLEKII